MDLLIKSVKQIGVILLVANALVLLTNKGIIGESGWQYTYVVLLALGVFCLRVFAEIAYLGLRHSDEDAGGSVEPKTG
ncbi:MAG: hypothetical protein JRI25_05465 [Deltaproteobacteria bacterium]|nr:hypothetical protein [Deltaproteobacteria bacterium]MBW2254031.1 hypothetical protein [Deltaproteobacteria bacterium]